MGSSFSGVPCLSVVRVSAPGCLRRAPLPPLLYRALFSLPGSLPSVPPAPTGGVVKEVGECRSGCSVGALVSCGLSRFGSPGFLVRLGTSSTVAFWGYFRVFSFHSSRGAALPPWCGSCGLPPSALRFCQGPLALCPSPFSWGASWGSSYAGPVPLSQGLWSFV